MYILYVLSKIQQYFTLYNTFLTSWLGLDNAITFFLESSSHGCHSIYFLSLHVNVQMSQINSTASIE